MYQHKLDVLRKKIDAVDSAIVRKLAERKKLSAQVGTLKAKFSMAVKDPKREQALMKLYERLSKQYQLHPDFVKHVFKTIIVQSRKLQVPERKRVATSSKLPVSDQEF